MLKLPGLRPEIIEVCQIFNCSQRRIFAVLVIYLNFTRYICKRQYQFIRERLGEGLGKKRSSFECRRLHISLHREGRMINLNKTYCLYSEEDLRVKRRKERKAPVIGTTAHFV